MLLPLLSKLRVTSPAIAISHGHPLSHKSGVSAHKGGTDRCLEHRDGYGLSES